MDTSSAQPAVSGKGFDLLRYFTWSSLAIIFTVFIVSGMAGAYMMHHIFLDLEREDAGEIATDFTTQMEFHGYKPRQWGTAAAEPELRRELEDKVQNLGITELTILSPDGRVLESFGPAAARREQLWSSGLEDARKGKVSLHWESIYWGPIALFSTGEHGLVETYVPVKSAEGKVTAIIKVRRNLAKVMDQNHRSLPPLMVLSALAAALVFLTLWFVIRKADHIIKSQQQQIAEANRQLAEHNRQLEELNVRKDEFLAICSHDLRSPLTSVSLGCSILLQDRSGLGMPQRDIVIRNRRSIETIVTLIDRLLDVARIEAGTETVELESCDLVKTIEESVALHAAQAQERGVHLELKLDGTELPITADRMKLLRICNNLLSNAIKHSPPGTVRVEASADASTVRFAIADQGPGIAREDQATLFDRFSALARRKKTRASGTGLGLFITRALVEMHGGKIDVESEPGHGATFRVTLPRRTAVPVERIPSSSIEHSHA